MTRTPEEVAGELGCLASEPSENFEAFAKIVELIRRDRREQAAPVLPLVKWALDQFYGEAKEGGVEQVDLFAAEQWLAEAEKEATKRCAVPTAKEERAKS